MRDPLELEEAALAEYLKTKRSASLLADPLPYDPLTFSEGIQWRIPFAAMAIQTDLQDVTNQLNHWLGGLQTWRVWNEVTGSFEENERWLVHWQVVEPIAFHCMFQPSWARDCLGLFAASALHHMAMVRSAQHPDRLPWDPKKPEGRRRHPRRFEVEKHLQRECASWAGGARFLDTLGKIDDEAHRRETSDFRNRSSHGIAPRFLVGMTRIVTRTFEQATTMRAGKHGFMELVPVPDKLVATYGYGGTEPLDPDEACAANLSQFERAREAFGALVDMLNQGMSAIAPGA